MSSPARRAAVLGHPISHSLSPTLHRAAYRSLGLSWTYEAIDVESAGLPAFLETVDEGWAGLSLTMPLKEAVLPLLTTVDSQAQAVRAVNTVVVDGKSRHGYNTDITGLVQILRESGVSGSGVSGSGGDARAEGTSATVLGAGATARSAVAALLAVGITSIDVVARRPEAASELLRLVARLGGTGQSVEWVAGLGPLERAGSPVVISTLPAEVVAGWAAPTSPQLLIDVIYDPWPTPLASTWGLAGGRVVGGFELLLRQTVEQVRLMTGSVPDIALMRSEGEAVLAERSRADWPG